MAALFPESPNVAKAVVGVVHAPPLPGAPRYDGDLAAVRRRVVEDAQALADGGVHALLIENFHDAPFFPRRVPACVVAHVTALACELRSRFRLPLGVNVLRNDGLAALAVAHAAGASFIRVNVLCGAAVTDQGIIQGIAHNLLRQRMLQKAESLRIFADVDVKHATPLGARRPIEEEAADVAQRGRADALIVSGPATGRPADIEDVRRVKAAAGGRPVLVGSGVTADNVAAYFDVADGVIVGTSLKHDGRAENPVDPGRVKALLRVVSSLRR